ncbi:hypothetical protein Ciccas_002318 [Cichlidogyrus casuarinus]|uniref:Progestin and adipoQ receptor family member 4 n=1 Tax=Cichlidogyrus casuarinus TaxID=1844966 RepID=A0ABD2QHX2_9PLAT
MKGLNLGLGKFDYLGASHQLWHIFVVMLMWLNLHAMRGVYEYQHISETCALTRGYQVSHSPKEAFQRLIQKASSAVSRP